ncbi:MAG TPA: hypothetical protein VK642_06365, partial [Burkholderiales bacterium]|nr:hypothetical protein [Burkholderiales bacterium]
MKRGKKWSIGLGVTAAVLGAAWLAVVQWLPTDEDLAARLTREAEERLGVKVSIGSAHWALLPKPVVVVNDFRTQQAQPVIVRRLSAHLNVRALMHRKLVFERVDIDEAVFPRNSVRAFKPKARASESDTSASEADADNGVPLEHFEFRNVTWISYNGVPVAYDGKIDFDPHWRPRYAELRRPPGVYPPFTLSLTREADADRWQTRIRVGGGTAHGNVALKTAANGVMHLSGQLVPRDIEVASAVRSFNRRSPVDGKGWGTTMLSASGKSAGELARSLHTRTTFSVDPAMILRFDLDKAIGTRGKERDGQTPLQELTGQMDTQNTDKGMRTTYTNVKARSGKYTATGEATVYQRQIEASGNLYLVEGTIGVPFTISGPVAKPKASVPPGFFAGAAIGTALLPGIGTVVGARIG